MCDYYLKHTLAMSFGDLMNDGRVGFRTEHLLWRLESALHEMPIGGLIDLLDGSKDIDFNEFAALRNSLADDALAIMDYERGGPGL